MARHLIDAVIFDMDGLIIDSEPLWREAEIEIFAEVGVKLSEKDCKETMGYRLSEVVSLWYRRQPWKGKSLKAVEHHILDRVSELIAEKGVLLPGVCETIMKVKDAGKKIAIASSSPIKLIHSVVAKLPMANPFDVLHSAQFEELGKPHPSVFISTATMLKVLPDRCLVLEDSFHGVVAALAAKMWVVAIPDKVGFKDLRFHAAHGIFQSLEEFALEDFEL